MQTSAIFDTKNAGCFEIDGWWCVRTDKEIEPVRTFCGQGERGSIFRDFVRTSFKAAPTANILFCFFRAYFSLQILQFLFVEAQKYFCPKMQGTLWLR